MNHLTRMRPGYICVAGIDLDTRDHIRPVLRYGGLTTRLLRRNGGPFDIACVAGIGPTAYVGRAPELEDHRFEVEGAYCDGEVPADYFWDLLRETSRETLQGIFGTDLVRRGGSCTVNAGRGRASLGCLAPRGSPSLYVNYRDSIRMVFPWLEPPANLSVTDLRLYDDDHKTPRRALVAEVQERIESGVEVILSVGLTRLWRKQDDTVERHWLQVNNIHLRNNPLWR